MNDFLSLFYESAKQRLRPLVTFPRVIYFFVLLLVVTPEAGILSFATLQRPMGELSDITIDALSTIPLWLFALIVCLVFGVIPFANSTFLATSTRLFHQVRGGPLIQNLVTTLESSDIEAADMKLDQIQALLKRKERGLAKFDRYKNIAEASTYLIFTVVVAFSFNSISLVALLVFAACWMLILYIVSQQMFICFLTEIKTYDVVIHRQRRFNQQ